MLHRASRPSIEAFHRSELNSVGRLKASGVARPHDHTRNNASNPTLAAMMSFPRIATPQGTGSTVGSSPQCGLNLRGLMAGMGRKLSRQVWVESRHRTAAGIQ
jgi:hypothetical protein